MPPRFLLVVDTAGALETAGLHRAAHDAGLSGEIEESGLALFVDPRTASIALSGGAGTILGTVFRGVEPPHRQDSLGAGDQEQALATGGASLMRDFWGAWIAVLRDRRSGAVTIARDPSPGAPCYYVRSGSIMAVATEVDLLVGAGLFAPLIDWSYLCGHLACDNLRPARTGLAGLSELLAGHALRLGPDTGRPEQLWSPWTFAARSAQLRDDAEAVARVRATVLGCVRAWASLHKHLLLGISGGLDSSIVAVALREAGARFTCITLATDDPAGDERYYARLVAEAVGADLVEAFEDLAAVDIARSGAAHLPRPIARAFAQSGDRRQMTIAGEIGADGYIHGGGGDNVFCLLNSVVPIADRVLLEGPGRGVVGTARDVSRLSDTSFLKVLRLGLGRAWFREAAYRLPLNLSLMSPAAIKACQGHDHPWQVAPRGALPGKAMHIAWLLGIQNHLEAFERSRHLPMVAPLLSQPLVELCLTIPTWMWCRDGVNRAIARRAFTPDLPPEIIDRRLKGSPTGFSIQLVEANRTLIRTMLLDGMLADKGLIDRVALTAILGNRSPLVGAMATRIMRLVDVEAWSRGWSATSRAADLKASRPQGAERAGRARNASQ